MPIVTLTSDYGWKDPDGAIVRGIIYSEMLKSGVAAPLIEITHSISPRNHLEAAYIVREAYKSFPKGPPPPVGYIVVVAPARTRLLSCLSPSRTCPLPDAVLRSVCTLDLTTRYSKTQRV